MSSGPGGLREIQDALLQVCFLPAHAAEAMWDSRFGGTLDVVGLPSGSHGLLPLLHRRLVELDRTFDGMDRLQGVRRRLWAQNEPRLRSVRAAVDVLDEHDVALLGGLAVLVAHHGRADVRALHDADLLVPASNAEAAVERLRGEGWQAGPAWWGGYLRDVAGVRCTRDGHAVSVRWSGATPYRDAAQVATGTRLADAPARAVGAADLLVHTVLDGPRVHVRADVLTVLQGDEPIDWDRVLRSAEARRGARAVAATFEGIERLVPLPVPTEVREALASAPRTPLGDPDRRPTKLRALLRRRGRR